MFNHRCHICLFSQMNIHRQLAVMIIHINIPKLPGPHYPPIANLDITTTGVERLLARLDPNKASGPDNISCRILKELAVELAPALTAIFNQSIDSGSLPTEWTKANVTPIYKKGNKNQAENYRPVSLTCVACKVLEHIICSHMHKHLEQHDILTSLQHGFRSRQSCETQLLVTLFDLLSLRDTKVQVDVLVWILARLLTPCHMTAYWGS